jgi:hypothetical protein
MYKISNFNSFVSRSIYSKKSSGALQEGCNITACISQHSQKLYNWQLFDNTEITNHKLLNFSFYLTTKKYFEHNKSCLPSYISIGKLGALLASCLNKACAIWIQFLSKSSRNKFVYEIVYYADASCQKELPTKDQQLSYLVVN